MATKFYAVREGYQPGIYKTWDECLVQEAKKNGRTPSTKPNRPKGSTAHALDRDTGRVVIYVSGACRDNQTSSIASAGTGLFAGVEHPDNQSKPLPGYQHSNNRAALVALLEAYKLIRLRNDGLKYEIRTVSLIAINSTTVWCRGWMKNGWKNAKRKPVANADIVQEILKQNTAMPGNDKITLKHILKSEQDKGIIASKLLAKKGVRSCRDVQCSCGQMLTHAH
ncbi:Ribonuclease H1 [Yarrowia lipolytica]|nr:Ribonuclease H1 [Yarrowia lipolytica]